MEGLECLIQCADLLLFNIIKLPETFAMIQGTERLLIAQDTFWIVSRPDERWIRSSGTSNRHCREFLKVFSSLKAFVFEFLRLVGFEGRVGADVRWTILGWETYEVLWTLGEFSKCGTRLTLAGSYHACLHGSPGVPFDDVVIFCQITCV